MTKAVAPPPPREIPIIRLIEGAAGLLIMANRFKRIVDEAGGDVIRIQKAELDNIQKTFRLSAEMIDDLAYRIERQEERTKALTQLLDFFKQAK